jgi:diguanylate cyclase (GGDEF)-like protein
MLHRIHQRVGQAHPGTILLLSLAGILIVAWVDYRTGAGIEVAVFYLPSIGAVAWYFGSRAGTGFAVLATVISLASDWAATLPHPEPRFVVINGGARLLFFLFAAGMISLAARQTGRLATMAREDPLTGTPNRRAFFEELERELERGRRHGTPLVLAYVDVDDFKQINDGQGGHAEGDAVLAAIGRALREGTRKVDVVGRLGGDEFALLLPETDSRQAERVIEHVLRLARLRIRDVVQDPRVTLSVGVVTFAVPPASADTAIALADACMYGVKQGGKNRISFRTWP